MTAFSSAAALEAPEILMAEDDVPVKRVVLLEVLAQWWMWVGVGLV